MVALLQLLVANGVRTWIRGVAPGPHYQALKFPLHGVVACSCNAGADIDIYIYIYISCLVLIHPVGL